MLYNTVTKVPLAKFSLADDGAQDPRQSFSYQ